MFANVTTDAMEVAKVAAMKAIADSERQGGRRGLRRFGLRHRHRQGSSHGVAGSRSARAARCWPSRTRRSPTRRTACRSSRPRFCSSSGAKWTHSLAINDLYYDFMGPSLQVAGLKGDGDPQNISAGDGSESAYQRIRDKDYQSRDRAGAAQHAGLAARRRTQPSLRPREVVRLRAGRPSRDRGEHRL